MEDVKQTNEIMENEPEVQEAAYAEENPGLEKAGKNPKRKKLAIVAAVVGAFLLLGNLVFGGHSVDMKQVVHVDFSGVSGRGVASVNVDYGMLAAEIPDKKADWMEDQFGAVLGDLSGQIILKQFMESAVRCSLEQNTGLENGDKVTVLVSVNENRCKDLGIKVKPQKLTYKVKGLTEVKEFDAFKDINVVFEGISPKGKATIQNNSEEDACQRYRYTLSKKSDLKIGDVVTVSIDESDLDWVAETTGKSPAELEKEYVVVGLDTYVTDIQQIPQSAIEEMKQDALDRIESAVAKNDVASALGYRYWNQMTTSKGTPRHTATYFLTSKEGYDTQTQNTYVLVYSQEVNITAGDSEKYAGACHIAVAYKNIVLNKDNQVEISLPSGSLSVYGADASLPYQNLVSKNKATYHVVVQDGV